MIAVVSTPPAQPAYAPVTAGDTVLWSSVMAGVPQAWQARWDGSGWSAPVEAGDPGEFVVTGDAGGGRTLAVVASGAGASATARLVERVGPGPWAQATGAPSPASSRAVAVAVGARGEAVIAWARALDARRARITVAWSRRPGRWSAPTPLGAPVPAYEGWTGPRVALSDDGRATVVWDRAGRVQAAAGVVGGRWAAPRAYGHGTPAVAAAGSRTVVAWVDGLRRVMVAGRGAWGLTPPRVAVQVPRGQAVGEVVPAVAADGTAIVVYTPQTGVTGPARRYRIRVTAVRGLRTGMWGVPAPLSPPLPVTSAPVAPTVAVSSATDAVVAWRTGSEVRSARWSGSAGWTSAEVLGTAGRDTRPVAAPATPGAWVAWTDAKRAVRVATAGPSSSMSRVWCRTPRPGTHPSSFAATGGVGCRSASGAE